MLGRSRGIRSIGQRPMSFGGGLASSNVSMEREEERESHHQVVPRRRPMSPLYERSLAAGQFERQSPKLLRDCLYDRMVDGEFHDVAEIDSWLPGNQWVQAMVDLIKWGFAFDKRERFFRLRKRRLGERRQYVVPLLSGVTLPRYYKEEGEATEKGSEVEDEGPFDDGTSVCEVPDEERMVLDGEGKLVLSALDMVTETIGILARKGAGKTYLGTVIAEEFLASSFAIPFVVLDPTGVWRGLGADGDGRPNDNRLVVFGGASGHYPLGVDQGRQLAKLVVGMRPLPVVLDLSGLSPEDQHGFVADFVGELYLLNKEPLHLFIDEADTFAPQSLDKSSKHQKRSLSTVDNLVRRGRTRGLGNTLITQRAAVINKNVLSQVGAMFYLRMGAPHDLDAAERWMAEQVKPEAMRECRRNLPILGQGQAYYLHGGDRYTFSRFTVRVKNTFDSSATPRMGETARTMKLAPLGADDRLKIESFLEGRSAPATGDLVELNERSEFDSERDDLPVLGQEADEEDLDDDLEG